MTRGLGSVGAFEEDIISDVVGLVVVVVGPGSNHSEEDGDTRETRE